MVNGMKMKETNKIFQVEKKAQSLSGSSPQGGGPKNDSSLSPPRSPGAARTKNDAQIAYRVRFERSIYGWKDNFKELSMTPVSGQNSFGVGKNRRNNMTSRICQGAAPPSFGLLSHVPCRAKWPKWWIPPWPPPATLGHPLGYKLSSRHLE